MDITHKAKEEVESRLHMIEDFIANKGLGSTYLTRARRVQRNINIALVVGGVISVIGLTTWLLSGSGHEEE